VENRDNQVSSTAGDLQSASWQEYYQYAQQLYETGDQEQAQAYYEIAQQLYEASGDDIGVQADAAEYGGDVAQQPRAPAPAQPAPQQTSVPPAQATGTQSAYGAEPPSRPSVNDAYTDLNSIGGATPSVAPPEPEKNLSDEALKEWAEEYSSLVPDPFEEVQRSKKQKMMMLSVICLGALVVIVAGVYLFWRSHSVVVQSTTPGSQSASTGDEIDFHSSKPTADSSAWNRTRPAGAVRRTRPRRGRGGGRKGKANEKSDDSGSFSNQKNISKDPMGGLDL